jgi:predicted aspartyl protease
MMSRKRLLIWLGALVIALVSAAAHARAAECVVSQYGSLDMLEGFGDLVVVKAAINGQERNFLVTTGRGVSSVTPHVVEELGLVPKDLPAKRQIYDFQGNRFRRFVTLSAVNFAGNTGENLDFLIEPDPEAVDPRVAGQIAKNILGNFDVDFDFAAKKLNLLSQEHCEGRVVYWSKAFADVPFKLDKNGNILVPMTLDGKEIEAMIDTAAPNTLLDRAVSRKLFGIDEDSPGVEKIPDASADSPAQYRYRFKSLAVKGISVTNPMIDLFTNAMKRGFRRETADKLSTDPLYGAEELKTADLILGLNVLRKLHLYIAYGEQKLYVTEAGAR